MFKLGNFVGVATAGVIISLSVFAVLMMVDLLRLNFSCDYKTKYREASAEVTKLRSRLSEVEGELSAAETQLLEASCMGDETRKALEAAQKGQQDTVEKLARERVTYSNARKELGTLRNTLNSTLAELASTHKTIESQATGLTTLQVELHRLQTCLDTSEEQRKQEALMHQAWVRHSLSTSSATMAKMRNLQDQVTSMRERCEVWYSMYRSTHAPMEGQIADMSSAMNQAHAKTRELNSLNEDLKREVTKLQAKLMSMEDDNALLRDEKWWLEGEFQKLNIELAECKESNRKLVVKWWKASTMRDDCVEKEEKDKETEEAIMAMVDSRLDTTVEMEWDLGTVVGDQGQQAEVESDDDDYEEYDDMESSEGDEKSDDDEDKVESLDGSEKSEAPSPTPVVQLYWETNIHGDGDENENDEDEYEYEYVDSTVC